MFFLKKRRFKILSIDGGGTRGGFPAAFLATIEERLRLDNIGDYFDLCVGTSAGAIISLGLGSGLNARDVFVEYETACRNIFGVNKIAGRLVPPRMKQARMLAALTAVLGDKRMSDSKVDLLVTTYDLVNQQPALYKTPHCASKECYSDVRMVDVAMGAAAIPVIFPAYDAPDGRKLVDGLVVANDPTLFGIIEAVRYYRQDPDNVDVLSIGCLHDEYDFHKNIDGWAEWLPILPHVLIRAQETTSQALAKELLGSSHRNLFRYNPAVPPQKYEYDDVAIIPELRRIAAAEAEKACAELQEKFFTSKAKGRKRK